MNFNELDLNLLVALDAVLAERNVTKAAKRLYLSQSAMSHALARLRRQLGDSLVYRQGNHLALTPRAQMLAGPVRDILLQVSAVLEAPVDFDPASATCELVVGMTEYTSALILPPLVAHLSRTAPGVTLTVVDHDPEAELGLESSDVHVVITQPVACEQPSCPLFEDEFGCLVAARHPAARDRLTPHQLAGLTQAVYTRSRALSDQPLQVALFDQRLEREVKVRVPSLANLAHAVLAADLVALMPRRYFDYLGRADELRLLDLPFKLPRIAPRMYWHELRTLDPAHRWLRSVLVDIGRSIQRRTPGARLAGNVA